MDGVIHSSKDVNHPWKNSTVLIQTKSDLLCRTGSRYAHSSPCEGLKWLRNKNVDDIQELNHQECNSCGTRDSLSQLLFIGKPCDTAAVSGLRQQFPEIDNHLGLVMTFFCAGTPSTNGTLKLIDKLGEVDRSKIAELHYRREGWPGGFRIQSTENEFPQIPYKDAWSQLTEYRPIRCNLCPDGLGRVADISCGDAWHRFGEPEKDTGYSLVLARTERGRQIVQKAIDCGYVNLRSSNSSEVLEAQASLLNRRQELWGRLVGLRVIGAPIPSYQGFSVFKSWIGIKLSRKIRSIVGTIGRAFQRSWWCRSTRYLK